MEALTKYLDMGGYAAWVWPGYGLAAVALIGVLMFTRRTLHAREQEFAHMRHNRRGPDDAP